MKKDSSFVIAIFICAVLLLLNVCYVKAQTEGRIEKVLTRLEEKMSRIKTLEAEFVQKKDLEMFEQSVSIRGTLFIQKPKRFAWHTEEPMRYSLVLTGDRAKQWDESSGRVENMSLEAKPDISTVITRIKDWFEGHFIQLQKKYNVEIESKTPLKLNLNPKESTYVYELIRNIKLTFKEDERYIDRVEIRDKEDNKTTIDFTEISINKEIDPEAWEAGRGVR